MNGKGRYYWAQSRLIDLPCTWRDDKWSYDKAVIDGYVEERRKGSSLLEWRVTEFVEEG